MAVDDARGANVSAEAPDAKRQKTGHAALRIAVVGGAGRAGLPLALVLAERGHRVTIVDTSSTKLETLRSGIFPFEDTRGPALLARCWAEFPERLALTSEHAVARECDVVVITIGTPVDEHLNPQWRVVLSCIEDLRPFLRSGQTLMLRCTLFPGTSSRIRGMLRDGAGLDVGVSCCPERLADGHAVRELVEVPQIVSGSDARALEHAKAVFAPLGVDLVELSLLEAEVSKLFLNAWRYVLFGTANQFYQIATEKGLDFDRIRASIMHRYKRASGFPTAGFTAGPQLFKDTMQLAAYCRHTFSLGHAAMLVNETMPDSVLAQAKSELGRHGKSLTGVRCGILGMTFKPDSDICKESLAFKLRRLLLWEGAEVFCTDVYVRSEGFVPVEELLEKCDLVFVGCPHAAYKHLRFRPGQLVFDCWGSLRAVDKAPLNVLGSEATNGHEVCHADPPPNGAASNGGVVAVRNGVNGKSSGLRVAIVGGAGHVGLPLTLSFAEHGHHVVVIDTDATKLQAIRAGQFPFLEIGGPELLKRCLAEFPERMTLTTEYTAARDCDVIIITIGTPVDEHLNPCFSVVEACIERLRPSLHEGQTLLLRSTLFPGTSSRVHQKLKASGLDVGVSFCPERIAQGYALEELVELPQIISGSDSRALEHARGLFGPQGVETIEMELQEAEVAKLFLNAWRYVAFGTANQFYHIATSKELDFDRIREAITYKYARASGFPRSGFTAGPCLFKDTMQLAAYCRHTFSLGHAAMLVNETMPDCLLEQARKHLLKSGRRDFAGVKCGILGMAFKPDNDDFRESLAFKLRRLLRWEGAQVFCTDVYLRRDDYVDLDKLLAQSELVFVGCPHKEYRSVHFREEQTVFDCWCSVRRPKLNITPGKATSCKE
eukprot:TRINITY_DN11793_c0_g1_i1.p1 TRINITY_DN11793_c0_g1~~TRINITY_DN11793_c0_g1_i1.p1  ORF type:complete len:887 (-),score=185.01 TRINITY_DN11793_c0_g1_i1:215-2875(-)